MKPVHSSWWVAEILPPDAVKKLLAVQHIRDPKERRIALDDVTTTIRQQYPEKMLQKYGR